MKSILVVDDNQNNRMILSLLIEDYLEENPDLSLDVKEAKNGREAVEMCSSESFDLVFMDIMMPEMDGIEATERIRENDKNVMIIAVSAVDDSERKKKILNHGAEDYISKPVNADIFQSRIANYLSIIESRGHRHQEEHTFNDAAVNLFTHEIFSRCMLFSISSDDALSEFWEYYLLEEKEKYDDLSDVVRTVYALGDLQVKLGVNTQIVVEESEQEIFFTLTNLESMDVRLIKLTLAKNSNVSSYKMDSSKISFSLAKVCSVEEEPLVPMVETATAAEPEAVASSVEYVKSAEELRVYNYMEREDLDEMEEFIGNLSSLLLIVGSSDMTDEEVMDIAKYIDDIARIMTIYADTYAISQALQSLAADISSHVEVFKRESAALGPLCTAFNNDIDKWLKMTFHEGSPSVNFMDDTIIANAGTLSGMLKMDDAAADDGGDLDDIFDF